MKKVLIIAAAIIAAVSCGQKQTNQQKMEAYDADMQAIMDEYTAAEDKDAAEDLAITKIVDLSLKTIKKNPHDTVALYALQNCYYYAEPEDLAEALKVLDPKFDEEKLVSRIKEGLQAKLGTKEGMMFTDFTVDHVLGLDEDGNEIIEKRCLSDYVGKGKYVLVDFWSPWCGPCKAEIPNLKDTYAKYAGDKFDMLSVAVWEDSAGMNWEDTRDTAAVYGIAWNQINNGQREPASLYGIDGIPHIILFGPDGTIVKRDLRGAALQQAVAEAVAK